MRKAISYAGMGVKSLSFGFGFLILLLLVLSPFVDFVPVLEKATETFAEYNIFGLHTLKEQPFRQAFGITCAPHSECVLPESNGGISYLFSNAAKEINEQGSTIRITEDCISACVNFADQIRPRVCITKTARFFVHKARALLWLQDGPKKQTISLVLRGAPGLSKEIDDEVKTFGGYPEENLLELPRTFTEKYWKVCPIYH
jgi:hypothetical protein